MPEPAPSPVSSPLSTTELLAQADEAVQPWQEAREREGDERQREYAERVAQRHADDAAAADRDATKQFGPAFAGQGWIGASEPYDNYRRAHLELEPGITLRWEQGGLPFSVWVRCAQDDSDDHMEAGRSWHDELARNDRGLGQLGHVLALAREQVGKVCEGCRWHQSRVAARAAEAEAAVPEPSAGEQLVELLESIMRPVAYQEADRVVSGHAEWSTAHGGS